MIQSFARHGHTDHTGAVVSEVMAHVADLSWPRRQVVASVLAGLLWNRFGSSFTFLMGAALAAPALFTMSLRAHT